MATILAVDDSKVIRDLVTAVLTQAGHRVIAAAGGQEALELAKDEAADLVLSDINMPGMGGIGLVSQLRKLEAYRHIPIIMVTTEDSDYKKSTAKHAGATGWLVKPFTPERLLNAVSKLVG